MIYDEETCPNCGEQLGKNYCENCGQKRLHLKLTLHDLSHEAFHEFVHFDGKIINTLRLLFFSPGSLTRDFVEGRRARSISPVRLYLIASFLFFFLVATVGHLGKGMIQVGSGTTPKGKQVKVETVPDDFDRRLEEGAKKIDADPARLSHALAGSIPKAMFLLMPFFGLLLLLLYRKTQPLYVPHLYFAIHFHAFAFFLLSLCTLLDAADIGALRAVASLSRLLLLPYLFVALRNVYGGTKGLTLAKTAVVSTLYFAVLLLTILGLVFLAMLQ